MWGILNIEGILGKAEVFIFSDVYDKHKDILSKEKPIFIIGSPSNKMEGNNLLKFIAKEIYPLDTIRTRLSNNINIRIHRSIKDTDDLDFIKNIATKNKGRCFIVLHLESDKGIYDIIKSRKFMIKPEEFIISELRNKFGHLNIWIT